MFKSAQKSMSSINDQTLDACISVLVGTVLKELPFSSMLL